MKLFLLISCLAACCIQAVSQQLTATRFEVSGPPWDGLNGAVIGTRETIPLVIANTSPIAQPIRFLTGTSGSVRAIEIVSSGDVWMRGSLSVGALTGAAPNELVRIATLQATGGRGLTIDMAGTTTSSGLLITNVNNTGTDEAGVLMQSVSNGVGTALRLGGPAGALRPTFGTGIDVTGGTGFRYNALNTGIGTAIEIGGTTTPSRGVDAIVSGTGHIGVLARANTNGTGVIGISQSAAYTAIPSTQGIGVVGRSASNSTTASDSVIGVQGEAIRGGNGGTQTTSIALHGTARGTGILHAGTSIGVVGTAESTAPGVNVAIGGAFTTSQNGLSLCTLGGTVLLGSANAYQPLAFTTSTLVGDTRTQTQAYSLQISGVPSFVNHNTLNLPQGAVAEIAPLDAPIVRVVASPFGSDILGVADPREGRMLVIINTAGVLALIPENAGAVAEHRIMTPLNAVLMIPIQGAVTLWYDVVNQRWRVIGTSF